MCLTSSPHVHTWANIWLIPGYLSQGQSMWPNRNLLCDRRNYSVIIFSRWNREEIKGKLFSFNAELRNFYGFLVLNVMKMIRHCYCMCVSPMSIDDEYQWGLMTVDWISNGQRLPRQPRLHFPIEMDFLEANATNYHNFVCWEVQPLHWTFNLPLFRGVKLMNEINFFLGLASAVDMTRPWTKRNYIHSLSSSAFKTIGCIVCHLRAIDLCKRKNETILCARASDLIVSTPPLHDGQAPTKFEKSEFLNCCANTHRGHTVNTVNDFVCVSFHFESIHFIGLLRNDVALEIRRLRSNALCTLLAVAVESLCACLRRQSHICFREV